MSATTVPQRRAYWANFDKHYFSTHPWLRPMREIMWELPHWMHWLGGVLVAHGYTSLDVADLYTSRLTVRDVLRQHPGDVYLFSPMTVNLPAALSIADVVKELSPGSVTIFGGVVATPLHWEVAAHGSVDYVVTGRGEKALPALLDALQDVHSLEQVGDLTYSMKDGTIRFSPHRYQDLPIREIPFPKIDLFSPSVGQNIRYLRQVYALGCPYTCSFCAIQTIGRKQDYAATDRVLAEIAAYRQHYGTHHHVYWGDETFTLHRERTATLLEALAEHGGIAYDCQTRLNCLRDQALVNQLAASGCRWIEIGLETLSQESHHRHKHHMRLDDVEETLMRLRDAGIAACAFALNGLPEQTADDMRRSIDWVCDLIDKDLLQASYLSNLVPYPGSALFDHPERFGMQLLHRDFDRYHEDLPAVYRGQYGDPDQTYQVFLDGVESIAQAMAKRPYFGNVPADVNEAQLGNFWDGSHS